MIKFNKLSIFRSKPWIPLLLIQLLFAFVVSPVIKKKDVFPLYNWNRFSHSKSIINYYQIILEKNHEKIDFFKSPIFSPKSNREFYKIQKLAKSEQYDKIIALLANYGIQEKTSIEINRLRINPSEFYKTGIELESKSLFRRKLK